jgi:hypothetical protein
MRDSERYRLEAAKTAALARDARTPGERAAYDVLSENWSRLAESAAEIEARAAPD